MCFRKFLVLVFTLQICLLSQVIQAETYSTSELEYKPKTKNSIELSTLNYQLFGIGISRDLWQSYSISTGIGFLPYGMQEPQNNPPRITNSITTVPITLRRYFLSNKHRPFLSGSVYNLFRSTEIGSFNKSDQQNLKNLSPDPKIAYDIGVATGVGYEFRANNGFEFRAGLELGFTTHPNPYFFPGDGISMLLLPGIQAGWRF